MESESQRVCILFTPSFPSLPALLAHSQPAPQVPRGCGGTETQHGGGPGQLVQMRTTASAHRAYLSGQDELPSNAFHFSPLIMIPQNRRREGCMVPTYNFKDKILQMGDEKHAVCPRQTTSKIKTPAAAQMRKRPQSPVPGAGLPASSPQGPSSVAPALVPAC